MTLASCVQKLEEQRAAAEEVALFAAEHPAPYREHQLERSRLRQERLRVKFIRQIHLRRAAGEAEKQSTFNTKLMPCAD
jgi:hypothetical protein